MHIYRERFARCEALHTERGASVPLLTHDARDCKQRISRFSVISLRARRFLVCDPSWLSTSTLLRSCT